MKPFSQACENNKQPILDKLRDCFANQANVIEIGSGTGQHAVHFAQHLPHVVWQTSDLAENHAGINAWIGDTNLSNLRAPMVLDANDSRWDIHPCDAVFTANTLHIMSWQEVEKLFKHLDKILTENGCLVVYGPFNYEGKFTSESNERFNQWLGEQAPHRAIRDFEAVCALASSIGLTLQNDFGMPANNRLLYFSR